MRMAGEAGGDAPTLVPPEEAAGEFKPLTADDLAPAEQPMAPSPDQDVVSEAAEATAENLPEFAGRRDQVMSALGILKTARQEAASSGIDVSEIDLSNRFVNVGEGSERKTLELTPENFVSLWSRLLESANPEQQQEILGLVQELVTEKGQGSLAARLFAEYGQRRPEQVSDRLNTGLKAVISKLKNEEEISPEIAKGLAIAAEQENRDKISLWSIIFWILGGLATVGTKGADAVIAEVIKTTGGGR